MPAHENVTVDRLASRRRRIAAALALAVGLTGASGCTTFQQSRRTMLNEPLAFPWKLDRQRSLKAYRSWAEQVWQQESGACPEPASEHYELGFMDGFVDFCYAGGDGQPPPVPPREFWNLTWRSPQGHSAADEWFAGYRHGANAAQTGGYRNLGIVYSSLRSTGHEPWPVSPTLLAPANSEELGPPNEDLPSPTPPAEPPAPADDKTAPAPDAAPAREETPAAPILGPPSEEAPAAAPIVPPQPTPPPAEAEAAPKATEPAAAPQGAAFQFRRAISAAAASTTQLDAAAGRSIRQPPALLPDAGPPSWPDPASAATAGAEAEIIPVSHAAPDANAPFAPRPKSPPAHE